MNPFLITTLIGIVLAVMSLGSVTPSVSNTILAKSVEVGVGREAALVQQIIRFKAVTGSYPNTVADLVSANYWSAADNDNGFGGVYAFSVDPVKNLITVSTTIADAARRAQYLGSFKHAFKPLDLGSGLITTTHVIPSTSGFGAPTPTSGAIPVTATAPDAATNTYWYDTSSGTSAVLMVSNGSTWSLASMGSGGIAAPNASNIVNSVTSLPGTATVGEVRYVYDAASNQLVTYVYYNGGWVINTGANNSANLPQRFQIAKSLRFRSSASSYLSRTPTQQGNARKWTFSTWVKRGRLSYQALAGTQQNGIVDEGIYFNAAGRLAVWGWPVPGGPQYEVVTAAAFNDPSGWYHVVVAVDTAQVVASERTKIHVNGVLQAVTGNYVPQNHAFSLFGQSRSTFIGAQSRDGVPDSLFDGLLAETVFIDGQALGGSAFGQTSPLTAQWSPKQYVGAFGTNGFYLQFNDTSSVAALGRDSSGMNNSWGVANMSLAAGAGYSSFDDTPTKNFAVMNPLKTFGTSWIVSDNNLKFSYFSDNNIIAIGSTKLPTGGKWYWEVTAETISSQLGFVGVMPNSDANSAVVVHSATTDQTGPFPTSLGTSSLQVRLTPVETLLGLPSMSMRGMFSSTKTTFHKVRALQCNSRLGQNSPRTLGETTLQGRRFS
jgi:hypothetical protein